MWLRNYNQTQMCDEQKPKKKKNNKLKNCAIYPFCFCFSSVRKKKE